MALRGPRTLRGRMVLATVAVALVVVATLVVLLQVFLATSSQQDAVSLAQARAQGVGATVTVRDGHPRVSEPTGDVLDRTAWVYDDAGTLLDGAPPSHLAARAARLAAAREPADVTVGTDLLHVEPLRLGGGASAVVVSVVDLTPYERAEQRSLWITIAFGVLAVVLAGVVAREVGRHALAAVHRMAARADEWREHDPGHRFDLGEPVDEITELGRTLDRLLDRIGEALSAERRLTDEIAHELRTPLAAIRGEAQLAALNGESADAIVAASDRLEASIRTLLDAARARDLGESGCDLRAALEPLVQGVGRLDAPPGPLPVQAGLELVQGLVGPLLDNARGHARAEVAVRVRRDGAETVTVQVLDDGPGVSVDEAEWVFEPGHSGRGGTGLGLAVVRRLAASAQAQVRAVPGDHGLFEVTLPVG